MMQVWMVWCRSGCSDAGTWRFWCRFADGVMQVCGWCDEGPWMVRCRSSDGAMQVPGCANFRNGNSVGESRNTSENMWAIIHLFQVFISEWTLSFRRRKSLSLSSQKCWYSRIIWFAKNVKNHATFVEGFWLEFYARGRFIKYSMSGLFLWTW